jgi:hypothetical protein
LRGFSRKFIWTPAAQVKALAKRNLNGLQYPVPLIDSVEYAGKTMVMAMGITKDRTKRILGL